MGNKLNTEKISAFIIEISETTDINRTYLNQEFYSFYREVSNDVIKTQNFSDTFKEHFIKLEDYQILNFVKNVLNFLGFELKYGAEELKDYSKVKATVMILHQTMANILLKHKNLRELFLLSYRDEIEKYVEVVKEVNISNVTSLDCEGKLESTGLTEQESKDTNQLNPLMTSNMETELLKETSSNDKQSNNDKPSSLSSESPKLVIESQQNPRANKVFPVNVFGLIINLYNDDDLHNKICTNSQDLYDFNLVLLNILYDILNYQKFHNHFNKTFVEYFDLSKFLVCSTALVNENVLKRFVNKLFINTTAFFKVHFNNSLDLNMVKKDYESYLFMNLQILCSFIFDYNKQFFSNLKDNDFDELYFETEFNEKAYRYLTSYNSNFVDTMTKNSETLKAILISILEYSNKAFITFVVSFLSNYEKLLPKFQAFVKILIIYFFEVFPDFSEMISLQRDFLVVVFDKLKFSDLLDLILLNKILKTKNFYLMIKFLTFYKSDSTSKNVQGESVQTNLSFLLEKSTSQLLIKFKLNSSLGLDAQVLFLLNMIYNLSCNMKEISDSNINNFCEISMCLYDLELTQSNKRDIVVIGKHILNTYSALLLNLEVQSLFVLKTLRVSEYIQNFVDNANSFFKANLDLNDKAQQDLTNLTESFERLDKILNRYRQKIENNHADIKFSQDVELLKIISKVLLDRHSLDTNGLTTKLLETRLFDTDIENFIALHLTVKEEEQGKLFL